MAPNKFEDHLKKELRQREIQPSKEAWNRVSIELDRKLTPKKKGYAWYAIAAGFIGLILISALYINSVSDDQQPKSQVVDSNENKLEEVEVQQEVNEEKNPTGIELVEVESLSESIESEIKKEKLQDFTEAPTLTNNAKIELADNLNDKFESEKIINSKVLDLVAQVNLLENENETLTDSEVDSLLRQAQQEILNDKLFLNGNSVDALALLDEVETELDKSFRDQIFESLKSGFIKVRTAVADRNN